MARRIGMRTMVAASDYGAPTFTLRSSGADFLKKKFGTGTSGSSSSVPTVVRSLSTPQLRSPSSSLSVRSLRAAPTFSPGLATPSMISPRVTLPSVSRSMVPGSARLLGPAPISPQVAANLDRFRQQAAGTPAFRGVLLAELETLLQIAKRKGFRRYSVVTRRGRRRDRISFRPYPQPGRRVSRLTMKIAYIRMLLGRTRNQREGQMLVNKYFGPAIPAGSAPSFGARPPVIPTGLETPTSYTYTTAMAGWGAAMLGPGMI